MTAAVERGLESDLPGKGECREPSHPRSPDPDPIVGRLRIAEDQPDAEDVVALVGFVGPGGTTAGSASTRTATLSAGWRFPRIVDSQQVNPGDELSRSVVWVDRQMMLERLFESEPDENDGRLDAVTRRFGDVPFSTWNLIPETRLAAAASSA